MSCSKKTSVLSWILQVVVAVILAQTLFFKFTGAPESVYIFTVMGIEPWGRYASGVAELIAAMLLLYSCTAWMGAIIALGVICGAIFAHLTKLGIVVQDDGGMLFGLAITVFVCSALIAWIHRRRIPIIGSYFGGSCPNCCQGKQSDKDGE